MTFRLVGCEHEIDKESCCVVHEEGAECPICRIETETELDFSEVAEKLEELQGKICDLEAEREDLLDERDNLKEQIYDLENNL